MADQEDLEVLIQQQQEQRQQQQQQQQQQQGGEGDVQPENLRTQVSTQKSEFTKSASQDDSMLFGAGYLAMSPDVAEDDEEDDSQAIQAQMDAANIIMKKHPGGHSNLQQQHDLQASFAHLHEGIDDNEELVAALHDAQEAEHRISAAELDADVHGDREEDEVVDDGEPTGSEDEAEILVQQPTPTQQEVPGEDDDHIDEEDDDAMMRGLEGDNDSENDDEYGPAGDVTDTEIGDHLERDFDRTTGPHPPRRAASPEPDSAIDSAAWDDVMNAEPPASSPGGGEPPLSSTAPPVSRVGPAGPRGGPLPRRRPHSATVAAMDRDGAGRGRSGSRTDARSGSGARGAVPGGAPGRGCSAIGAAGSARTGRSTSAAATTGLESVARTRGVNDSSRHGKSRTSRAGVIGGTCGGGAGGGPEDAGSPADRSGGGTGEGGGGRGGEVVIQAGGIALTEAQAKLYGLSGGLSASLRERAAHGADNPSFTRERMETLAAPKPSTRTKADLPSDVRREMAECTFKPKRSSQAVRAMQNDECGYDWLQDYLENDNSETFVDRMEARERNRRREKERRIAQIEYDARLDKLSCPQCGNEQTYDEFSQMRTNPAKKKCSNCRVPYRAKRVDTTAFHTKLTEHERRREERLAKAQERIDSETFGARNAPSKSDRSRGRSRSGSRASHAGAAGNPLETRMAADTARRHKQSGVKARRAKASAVRERGGANAGTFTPLSTDDDGDDLNGEVATAGFQRLVQV